MLAFDRNILLRGILTGRVIVGENRVPLIRITLWALYFRKG